MYKLFRGIIYERLQTLVERNQILPPSQYGFRRKLSTTDTDFDLKKQSNIASAAIANTMPASLTTKNHSILKIGTCCLQN